MAKSKIGPKVVIPEDLKKFLLNKGFVSVGTCDLDGYPNAAPKYIIKIEGDFIYLGDYVLGRTYRNLDVNPRISLSTVDMKTLEGWQINGTAELISSGAEHKSLLKEMVAQEVRHSARRIIEEVRGEGKYDTYQISFPEKVVIFKVKCERIARIGSDGKLQIEMAH